MLTAKDFEDLRGLEFVFVIGDQIEFPAYVAEAHINKGITTMGKNPWSEDHESKDVIFSCIPLDYEHPGILRRFFKCRGYMEDFVEEIKSGRVTFHSGDSGQSEMQEICPFT